ncbi:unnamed protein product [Brassica rapa subsp. narinosa]
MFTKGLLEVFGEVMDHHPDHYRFYFPFNLDKKHWVGLCVDASSWIITVFDCNTSLREAKTVPRNIISAYSLLASVLLMQTHYLSGIKTCRCIAPHILASEAQRVAVMLYEFHMKL